MRRKIVAGNWKMNKTLAEADELVAGIVKILDANPPGDITVIFAPPYPYLISPGLTNIIASKHKDNIFTAAQNCHWEEKGAYTGEISAAMLRSAGVAFVIIGHSERRQYFKEDNALLAKKVERAIAAGLQPVYCCGEVLEERKAERHFEVVKQQIEGGLFHLSPNDFRKAAIAYEPVWAIGTGETATPGQAQEMHACIRQLISGKYGEEIAQRVSLLYGGSCSPSNARELFAQPDIDGGLIGGASLNAEDFTAIIHSF